MGSDGLERRVDDLEVAAADLRAWLDRQIQDLTARLEILEKFLTERFG